MLLVYQKRVPQLSSYFSNNSHPDVVSRNSKLTRQKIYWICQLSGWSVYALVNVIVSASMETFTFSKFLLAVLLSVLGIFLTHEYRNIVVKQNWVQSPLKKLIPRVLISSIAIGLIIFSILALINYFTGIMDSSKLKFISYLVGIFNLSSVVLLWSLIYFSVHYFENYKRVEIESLIWEAAVKDFELKTLKSQLNPHFMFNALNSIRALIEEDPGSAKIAVTKLSNILRYSLKIERTETVSLEDEMKTVKDYLSLESIRFEERLKYEIKIDPKSLKIEIPPMMIQTLVENGIKHGISSRPEGGEICICSKIENSALHIEIRNNGKIEDDALKISKGFGINNTKHRLNLLYGEEASFKIHNSGPNEVTTELIIPTGGVKNESFNN